MFKYAAGMSRDEPRWLNDDESATWVVMAKLLGRLPAALDTQLQHDAGLNMFEYHVLVVLSESPDRTSRMSSLARLANGSISRISHGVRRLEKRGWVRREPCPGDGRSTNAVLTEAGYAKVVATAPEHVRLVRSLVFDALTAAQQRHFREAGSRILGRMDDLES